MRLVSGCCIILILLFPGLAINPVLGLDLPEKLATRVSYDFAGEALPNVLSRVAQDTGLNIMPLESVLASRAAGDKIYLTVEDMPLRQFLSWLAATLQARYKLYADGRVYLSQNYEWVERDKFGMLFLDIEDIVGISPDLQSLDGSIAELSKIVSIFDNNYYIRIEEQADMVKLVAHTPRDLKEVFANIVRVMGGKGEDIAAFEPVSTQAKAELVSKLRLQKVIDYPYLPLNQIIRRLEMDFGVNIGCSSAVFAEGKLMPELSLKLGKVSLKEAIEAVVAKTDFVGVELSFPGGIWLTRYESDWVEGQSRQFLWSDNLVVKLYDMTDLSRVIPGDLLVEELYTRVAPRAWLDPLASLVFNNKNKTLLVLAEERVQQRVQAALYEVLRRLVESSK